MSSTKDGAASNKVMSAMGEVETFIAAVKEKTADEVRDAARAFEKKTGGAVSGLGDASGRTPLHLVRARPAPRPPSPLPPRGAPRVPVAPPPPPPRVFPRARRTSHGARLRLASLAGPGRSRAHPRSYPS